MSSLATPHRDVERLHFYPVEILRLLQPAAVEEKPVRPDLDDIAVVQTACMHGVSIDESAVCAAMIFDVIAFFASCFEGGMEPGNERVRKAYHAGGITADRDVLLIFDARETVLGLFQFMNGEKRYILFVNLHPEFADASGNDGAIGQLCIHNRLSVHPGPERAVAVLDEYRLPFTPYLGMKSGCAHALERYVA